MIDTNILYYIVLAILVAIFLPRIQMSRRTHGLPFLFYARIRERSEVDSTPLEGYLADARKFLADPRQLAIFKRYKIDVKKMVDAFTKPVPRLRCETCRKFKIAKNPNDVCKCTEPVWIRENMQRSIYMLTSEPPTPTKYSGLNLIVSFRPLDNNDYRIPAGIRKSMLDYHREPIYDIDSRGTWVQNVGPLHVHAIMPLNQATRNYDLDPLEMQPFVEMAPAIAQIATAAQNLNREEEAKKQVTYLQGEVQRTQQDVTRTEMEKRGWIRVALQPKVGQTPATPNLGVSSSFPFLAIVVGLMIAVFFWIAFPNGYQGLDSSRLAITGFIVGSAGWWIYKRQRP